MLAASFFSRGLGECVSSGPSNIPRPPIPTPRHENEPRNSLDRTFLGRSRRIDSQHSKNGVALVSFSATSGGQCGVARRGMRRTQKTMVRISEGDSGACGWGRRFRACGASSRVNSRCLPQTQRSFGRLDIRGKRWDGSRRAGGTAQEGGTGGF